MSLLRLLQRSRPPLSLRPAPSACYATAALKQPKLTKTTQLRADRSSVVRPVSSPDGQAIAFSTAERYNIDALRRNLWDQGLLGRGDGKDAMNLMGEAIWIPTWPVPAPTASESQEQTSHEKIQSSERVGEIFVFESGSIVAWNMAQADAQSFIDQVISSTSPNSSSGVIALPSLLVEREKYNEVQTEAMDFIVRYGERTGVRDDLIVIGRTENGDGEGMHQAEEEDERRSHRKAATPPLATAIEPLPTSKATTSSARKAASSPSAPVTSPSPDMMPLTPLHSPSSQLPRGEDDLRARLSLSSGLARSTKLAMYEEMLESYMDEVSSVPAALSSGSDAPLHKRDIVRNTGNLLLIRQGLNLNEQNLIDPPEMFWSNAPLEGESDRQTYIWSSCREVAKRLGIG